MKKLIFCFILTALVFPVFAIEIREARIFVPPVAGVGRPGDNAFFYRQLTSEVIFQYYALVRSQRICDYILRATIIPFGEEDLYITPSSPVPDDPIPRIRSIPGRRNEYFSWEIGENIYFYDVTGQDNYDPFSMLANRPDMRYITDSHEFTLRLELIDNATGELIGEQRLVYVAVDASVGDLLSIQVYNMLAGIPDIEETNDWRDNWLFLETSLLWSPRIYIEQNQSVNWLNFGLRASLEFHFTNFLSLGAGAQFVQDWVVTSIDEHRDLVLEIPLALKIVLKPSNYYMLEPYGGIAFNFSLLNATIPSPSSWFVGLQFGVKAGAGMIVIDPRFSMDLGKSALTARPIEYQRNSIQIGVGYKIGFFLKRSILDY